MSSPRVAYLFPAERRVALSSLAPHYFFTAFRTSHRLDLLFDGESHSLLDRRRPREYAIIFIALFFIVTLSLHQEGMVGALASLLALILFGVLYALDEVTLIRESDLQRLRHEEEKRLAEEKSKKEPQKEKKEEPPRGATPPSSQDGRAIDFKTVIYDRVAEERKLLEAVREGNLNAVITLVEQGVSVDAENQNGITALMFATKFQHPAIVSYLIEQGADVNKKAKNGLTAMHIARELKNQEIIDLLSSGGALD